MVTPKPRGLMITSRLILEILINLGSLNPGCFRVTRGYQSKFNRLQLLIKKSQSIAYNSTVLVLQLMESRH